MEARGTIKLERTGEIPGCTAAVKQSFVLYVDIQGRLSATWGGRARQISQRLRCKSEDLRKKTFDRIKLHIFEHCRENGCRTFTCLQLFC